MRNAPHLVVSITGHGFGHVAQTAPVLNLLHRLLPELRLTVRSARAPSHLRTRIHAPFTHINSEGDIGMVMSSALDVLAEDSRAAYRAFHRDWDKRVAAEADLLRELGADFVFSNVGYLALAGAQRAGMPNAALCSLNWADIYRHYCGNDAVAAQIQACYANADAFLRATPGMAMPGLPNLDSDRADRRGRHEPARRTQPAAWSIRRRKTGPGQPGRHRQPPADRALAAHPRRALAGPGKAGESNIPMRSCWKPCR